jgi:hypothetical protein
MQRVLLLLLPHNARSTTHLQQQGSDSINHNCFPKLHALPPSISQQRHQGPALTGHNQVAGCGGCQVHILQPGALRQ